MEIEVIKEDNKLELKLIGRLDTTTVERLETTLKQELTDQPKLVLNFEKLEYISSAGLRVVLACHKQMAAKEGLTLTNVNESIMEIFEMTGFLDFLDVAK